MTRLTRRVTRLGVMTVGFAGLFLAMNAVPGGATPPQQFGSMIVARGTYMDHGSLPLGQGQDIVVSQITVQPGGSSGWHSHPGGAIGVVAQGKGKDAEALLPKVYASGTLCKSPPQAGTPSASRS